MLPSEYEPLKLSPQQQEVHRRYTALGFKICPRPFAGKDTSLYFFMSRVSAENSAGSEFTINLGNGIAVRTGTYEKWNIDEAEKAFGGVAAEGELQAVSPPCDSTPAVPVAAAEVAAPAKMPVKETHAKAQSREEKPVAVKAEPVKTPMAETQKTLGGLTPPRSPMPEKSAPVKKKQTALF